MRPDRKSYWRRRLMLQGQGQLPVINALTPEKKLGGINGAHLMHCDDGGYYAVKGLQTGRSLIADRLVGLIAHQLGHPVPLVKLVNVPSELTPFLHSSSIRWLPGVGHGSAWLESCVDSRNVMHVDAGDNRARFTDLAILFGCTMAFDEQFLYQESEGHRVWSVDHGYFLECEYEWSERVLEGYLSRSLSPHFKITTQMTVVPKDLATCVRKFEIISDEVLASQVGAIPDAWGVSIDEKILFCELLSHNRDAFLRDFGSLSQATQ